jgi:hypothetical protein
MLDSDLIIRFANRTVAENGQGGPRRTNSVVGSQLVEGFVQRFGDQVEPSSGNKRTSGVRR